MWQGCDYKSIVLDKVFFALVFFFSPGQIPLNQNELLLVIFKNL